MGESDARERCSWPSGTVVGKPNTAFSPRALQLSRGYRPVMATHDVTVDLPTRFVLHSDVTFVVWSDDAKLGELQVSKGSIDWLPGNGRTRHRMRWEQFSDFMKLEGRASRR
jgi:hypothetical protein